ncbi:glycosyltransferase family 2 protein [Streptomyces sp. NPDC046977]|uniref:glycosyltransferase family 2 protein n=1 Tax=Streptomyces sp. NPDC046977 TaxID=3154703 RepID=UPI0033E5D19B
MSPRADADPLITVIVPAYNAAQTLARTLDSIAGQTFHDVEVVVVDDASTDSTRDVAESYSDRVPGFRLIRREDNSGGVGAPRNDGVRAACGKYVMFLDADDQLPEKACEVLVAVAERTGSDITAGRAERVNHARGTRTTWQPDLYTADRYVAGVREWPELLTDPIAAAKLFRREFLVGRDIRFPEGLFYEDTFFSVKAYHLARGISVLTEPVYHWIWEDRQGAGASITNRRNEIRSVSDRIEVHRRADAYLREAGARDLKIHKDVKFLGHDVRLYMKELRRADDEYRAGFIRLVSGYLAEVDDESYRRCTPLERVRAFYLRHGMIPEALTVADFEQRRGVVSTDLVIDDGRVYWSAGHLDLPDARAFLDVTELGLQDEPFESSRMFNRALSVEVVGKELRISGEILNQFGRIGAGDGLELVVLTRSKERGRKDVAAIGGTRVDADVIGYAATAGLRKLFAGFPAADAVNLQVQLLWKGRRHITAVCVRGIDLAPVNEALRDRALEAYETAGGNLAFRRCAEGGSPSGPAGWKDRLFRPGRRRA